MVMVKKEEPNFNSESVTTLSAVALNVVFGRKS